MAVGEAAVGATPHALKMNAVETNNTGSNRRIDLFIVVYLFAFVESVFLTVIKMLLAIQYYKREYVCRPSARICKRQHIQLGCSAPA
jgi:hypothetical protein